MHEAKGEGGAMHHQEAEDEFAQDAHFESRDEVPCKFQLIWPYAACTQTALFNMGCCLALFFCLDG